jgi:hypothetical protein
MSVGKRRLKKIIVVLGFGFSLLFLYLSLRQVEWSMVAASIRSASIAHLALALGSFGVCYAVRIMRWQTMLTHAAAVRYADAWSATTIGYFANNLLPAHLGEVVRAFIFGRKTGTSRSLLLATIFMEKLLDFVMLVVFLALLLGMQNDLPDWIHRVASMTGLFTAAGVIIVVGLIVSTRSSTALVGKIFFFLSPAAVTNLQNKLELFTAGLRVFGRVSQAIRVAVYSIVPWVLWVAFLHFALLAFDLRLPISGLLLMTALLHLGILIPSSPGYVGTYQFICVTGLGLFDVSRSTALGFSLVFHALWYVPLTAFGVYYLWQERLGLSGLISSSTNVGNAESQT